MSSQSGFTISQVPYVSRVRCQDTMQAVNKVDMFVDGVILNIKHVLYHVFHILLHTSTCAQLVFLNPWC